MKTSLALKHPASAGFASLFLSFIIGFIYANVEHKSIYKNLYLDLCVFYNVISPIINK
jgi:hypothetical protein